MSSKSEFSTSGSRIAVTTSTGHVHVDYKNEEALRRLMSPNGKINGRKRTGLTAFEQRLAARAIKQARYMAILPYTSATL